MKNGEKEKYKLNGNLKETTNSEAQKWKTVIWMLTRRMNEKRKFVTQNKIHGERYSCC